MDLSGVIYIWREPVLTTSQFSRLSNIFDNAGSVFLAIGVAAPLFTSVDKPDWLAILAGGILAFVLWLFSVLLARKVE